jgi:hypothetical protein
MHGRGPDGRYIVADRAANQFANIGEASNDFFQG